LCKFCAFKIDLYTNLGVTASTQARTCTTTAACPANAVAYTDAYGINFCANSCSAPPGAALNNDFSLIDASLNCLTSCPVTAPFWQASSVNVVYTTANAWASISHRFVCVAECTTLAVGADMICYPNMQPLAPLWRAIPNHTTQLYKWSAQYYFHAVQSDNYTKACPFGSV
jgi:hypothetical protein